MNNQSQPIFRDMSVCPPVQVENLLQAAIKLCDYAIQVKNPEKESNYEETFWNIRLLVESALVRYETISADL